jgi:type I restriction enzyme S subunit
MSNYSRQNLGSVADLLDCLHKTPNYTEMGIPIVRVTDVKRGYLNLNGTLRISEADYELFSKGYTAKNGDIVFTRVGSYGIPALVKNNNTFCLGQNTVLIIPKNIEGTYLFYWLCSPECISEIESLAGGSTQPTISMASIRKIEVSLPPLPEQRAIAEVLSSLDDKIDLLHRNNKTLEEMAEALFRQWFVVEAKEEWEVKKLDDILTTVGGTTPSTTNPDFWDGNICWTSPRDITTLSGIYLFDTERKITEKGLSKISSGLLPKGSLLMSSRAPVGVLAFAEVPVAINQGYIAILDNKGFDKLFIYLWLKHNMEYVHSFSNGSTFMEISKSAFKSLEIVLPPLSIVKSFIDNIKPLFDKIKHNELTIKTLSRSRDILLPKLMSGQVRVKDL